jgi:Outer membrane protein beta-barrel domain
MKFIYKNAIGMPIALLLLFSTPAIAQDAATQTAETYPKFVVGLTGGLTLPIGKFAQTVYCTDVATASASAIPTVNFNTGSGFAGAGGNCGITGTVFLNKHWGIGEYFSYRMFSNAGGQNMALGMQSFPGGFDVDSVTFNFKGNSETFTFLVGPVYTFSPLHKLDVDVRLLVGFVNASLAGNSVTLTDGGVTDPTFYQAVSWANTFGGQLGAGVRYPLSKQIGIGINVDYFYSKPDFTVNNINRNNPAGREIFAYNEPIEGFDFNATLSYTFRK